MTVEEGSGKGSSEALNNWRANGQIRNKVTKKIEIIRDGELYPSMMSTCSQSAPQAIIFSQSCFKLQKSAERIEGDTVILVLTVDIVHSQSVYSPKWTPAPV